MGLYLHNNKSKVPRHYVLREPQDVIARQLNPLFVRREKYRLRNCEGDATSIEK